MTIQAKYLGHFSLYYSIFSINSHLNRYISKKTPSEQRVGEVLISYYHLNNNIEKSVHLFYPIF